MPTDACRREDDTLMLTTKDDKNSPAARDKCNQIGLYAATLIMMHMKVSRFQKNRAFRVPA